MSMRPVCDNERLLTGWDHVGYCIIDSETFSFKLENEWVMCKLASFAGKKKIMKLTVVNPLCPLVDPC